MTMMQNRQYRAVTTSGERFPGTLPAAEWDISSLDSRAGKTHDVRALSISSLPSDLDDEEHVGFDNEVAMRFETHREKREGFVVGIGLGVALIVGAALGGAFSGEQAMTPTPTQAEFAFYAQQ